MKILTICPSIYPERFKITKDSFDLTISKNTYIYIVPNGTVTSAINHAFETYPDYDFYHVTNDDCIYKTPNWDIKLAKKGRITYGNDLLQGENLCTFPMIDGDIVRALGWLQLPTLEKYAGDVVWKFIGTSLGILEYIPDVIIEHKWEGCSDPEINKRDMTAFAQWLPFAFKDLKKVRDGLQNNSN